MLERRKDTQLRAVKLPRDYLDLVEKIFHDNFKTKLNKENKEMFLVFGEMYPDEVILAVSLKYPDSLFMTTCYASVDFPPKKVTKSEPTAVEVKKDDKPAQKPKDPQTEQTEESVHLCVDAIASFFNTFFEEGRPLDYDNEYRQNWSLVELEKNKPVYLRINRDNLELDTQASELLEKDEAMKEKNKKPVH